VGIIQSLFAIQQGQQEPFFPTAACMGTVLPAAFKVVQRRQAIEGGNRNSVFALLIPVDDSLLTRQDLFAQCQVRAIVSEPWASGAMLKKPKGGLTFKLQHTDIFWNSSSHTILLQAKASTGL
jgi:hypothetical protein